MQDLQSFYRKLKELDKNNQSDYVTDPYNEHGMLSEAASGTSMSPDDISNIYNAESASGQLLKNRQGSSAKGQFQFLEGTEDDIKKRILPKQTQIPSNPLRKQALLMNAYTKYNEDRLKKFNIPVTKENLYALHHEGTSGGLRAIKQKDTPEGKEKWNKIMAQLSKEGTGSVASMDSNNIDNIQDVIRYPKNYIEE